MAKKRDGKRTESSSGIWDIIRLSRRKEVPIAKQRQTFRAWSGKVPFSTYGRKPVVKVGGKPLFAELAVLRLLKRDGWDGVWVDRTKFRKAVREQAAAVPLRKSAARFLQRIRDSIGKSKGGCWDVFAWKKGRYLFVECKRQNRDRMRRSQKDWLAAALKLGVPATWFRVVEWDILGT